MDEEITQPAHLDPAPEGITVPATPPQKVEEPGFDGPG